MSWSGRLAELDARVEHAARRGGRFVFADRTGLVIFLGALALYMLYWRVDVFIVDTFVVADTLANLGDGHLHLETLVFGPDHGRLPGMHVVDGRLYGRNYGHAFLSLPVLFALEGASLVAEPRVLLAGVWSLVVLAFAIQIGRLAGRERVATLGGATVALVLFGVNLALATVLPAWVLPLVALQLTSMAAGALVGVTVYRLVGLRYGYRSATFAGITVVLLGPMGFWASIPKRHVLTALLALLVLFAFTLSRERTGAEADRYRALAYVPVGLSAWVSAPEGLVLLVVLLPVDLLTARSNDARSLTAVGIALTVGLLPFLLTNLAISGDPLAPPRMLPDYDGATSTVSAGGATTASTAGGVAAAAGPIAVVLGSLDAAIGRLFDTVVAGLSVIEPSRLYHVYVRSGHIPGVDYSMTGGQTVEMSVLESAPILAALLVAPATVLSRFVLAPRSPQHSRRSFRPGHSLDSLRRRLRDPVVATDLFVLGYVSLLCLVYLPRLPLHSTITVRYLVPAVPFLLYGVVRQRAVREAIEARGDRIPAITLLAVVGAVGFAITLFGLASLEVGTVVQLTAIANLGVAAAVAAWALGTTRGWTGPRSGAVVLALAVAAMAAFLLLSGLEYFGHGREFALPVAQAIERMLPVR